MHVTLVKKRLDDGTPCPKCAEVEAMLRDRGLWERIDRVVWADVREPDSEGWALAREHGVDRAPFFLFRDAAGAVEVVVSALRAAKRLAALGAAAEPASDPPGAAEPASDLDAAALAALDTQWADKHPREAIRWALERWGADCAIAFSGAEDVVLIDIAASLGLPFSVFCLDTGRLHPETYRFIDAVRQRYGVAIEMMGPDPAALEPFVRTHGLFSFYEDGHHACCAIRKVAPLRRQLAGRRAWITGQRKDQSPTRHALDRVQLDGAFEGVDGPLVKLNPLADWSSARVWGHIRGHGLPYNALHDRGFVSIGCEPCTRPVNPGQHEREGRWWWEEATQKECGLHIAAADGEAGQSPDAPAEGAAIALRPPG